MKALQTVESVCAEEIELYALRVCVCVLMNMCAVMYNTCVLCVPASC